MVRRCVRLRFLLLLSLAAFTATLGAAGQTYTVSGYIEDATSGERISGATLYLPSLATGATSNQFGFYSLAVDTASVRFVVSHIAYTPVSYELTLAEDTTLLILLTPRVIGLDEVEVVAEGESALDAVQMSVHDVQVKQIETLPVLLGEVDIQKVLQLLPGVQAGTEGTSGLYVRGGRPDQNLTLMDGIPLYNPSHIFGFLSVFNAPAMKRVEFIKGAFPARYGGRLSSVVNYTMKEGNLKEFSGEATIGLVASRAMIEGPILRDKASFVVAARRSYIDVLAAPFISQSEKPIAYFYDLNAKANMILSSRDRVYLSGFAGQDKFGVIAKDTDGRLEADFGWHNRLVSLRWNHQYSDRMFANTLVGVTNYELGTRNYFVEDADDVYASFDAKYRSEIVDWIGKIDFEYSHSLRHYLRFGAEGTIHHFNPGTSTIRLEISDAEVKVDTSSRSAAGKLRSAEAAVYAEDEIRLSRRLRVTAGIRLSGYTVDGTNYGSVEPRLSANYRLTETMAAKMSWASAVQYVHLLTQGALALPTDLWVPSLSKIKPQRGYQVAAGVVKTLADNMYEVSVETYYKRMLNYLEYEEGAGLFESATYSWPELVEVGEGTSYGLEVFAEKKVGRLTGWLAYTLAKTTRTFERLNLGKPFPDGFDRRHDIAVVGQFNLSRKVLLSGNWIYGSGYPVWVPIGRFRVRSSLEDYRRSVVDYGPVNSARAPASHRLDASLQLRWGHGSRQHMLQFGAYNVYARANPTLIFFDIDGDILKVKQVSLLRWVPSVSYQIRF